MMTCKQFLLASSLLLLNNAVEASLSHYFRGGLRPLMEDIERVIETNLLSYQEGGEEEASTPWNETHRQLQGSLTLESSFMSQVNKTYVFPEALNPDCASGNDMVIGVTQLNIEGINRATQEPVFSNSLRYLFRSLRPYPTLFPKGAELMTPRVVYDPNFQRFVVTAAMTDKESFSMIYVAVSKTSTPQSGVEDDWEVVAIDAMDVANNQQVWANDLALAVDSNALYLTATMHSTEDINQEVFTFVESRLWIINKLAFLSTLSNPSASLTALPGTLQGFSQNIFAKVMAFDKDGAKLGPYIPTAVSGGAYMVAYNDQESTDAEELHVVHIADVLGTSDVSSSTVVLGDIDIDGVGGPLPGASQPDPGYSPVETGSRQVNDAVLQDNFLYVVTTVEDVEGETSVFWAKINIESNTADETGFVNGESIATGTSTFFPSIAVGPSGDAVIGYGASGSPVFAGMYVSPTSASSSFVEVKAGEDNYESIDGLTYHGQNSGLSADPVDANCYWALNSFARASDPFQWNTWERGALAVQWGKVCISQ